MNEPASPPDGSLVVVGIGIMVAAQVTVEALGAIQEAEVVLYVVPTSAESWLRSLNPRAQSLAVHYADGKRREDSYREMVTRILAEVRAGRRVCAVFYGHPGVFVNPSHRAIAQAKAEGYDAQMLPGISAEDCLFADLGIDPSASGCHSFEATDFLIRRRSCDPTALLVLWQVGALGERSVTPMATPERMRVLGEVLLAHYPPEHEVILYEASRYPVCSPIVQRVPLAQLGTVVASPLSTLVVPPSVEAAVDAAMVRRLSMTTNAATA